MTPLDQSSWSNIRRATAFHEAGHAVAAVVLGISVRRLSLRGPIAAVNMSLYPLWLHDELHPRLRRGKPLSRPRARDLADIFSVLYAGRVAEECWLQENALLPDAPFFGTDDFWEVAHLAKA